MSAMSNAHLWPDDLDALHAAPGHHTLLFENESVRVLDTHVLAGQTVPLHTHRWPAALYILSWSHFVRRDGEGAILVDSRMGGEPTEGVAVWSAPLPPHTLENVGGSELRVISVELKGPVLQAAP
jgi:quercetin dioxygenase-like cupin family protein